jgi:hypothetical protein
MRASAIQKLSVSKESSKVAAAFSENTVQVWDLFAREKVTEFETVFSFGGGTVLPLTTQDGNVSLRLGTKESTGALFAMKLTPES